MEQKKSLTVQTLHAVVDFIVQDLRIDCCELCIYYNKARCCEAIEKDEDCDPCAHHRRHGDVACRNGIIEAFQMKLTEVQG